MRLLSSDPPAIAARPLAAGVYHTCALNASGATYCWGEGRSGQLGDGSSASSATPLPVAGGITFRTLAAGGAPTTASGHTCGLTLVGAAYCWGGNGNLGSASTSTSTTPVAISGGLSFSVLVSYEYQTCGLTSAGVAYCWGDPERDNSYSQTPYAVSDGFTLSALAAGGAHDCALTPDGAAYCWGSNESGQLGVGDTTHRWDPVRVGGTGLRWAAIAAGGVHTCVLTPSGEAYCWGSNRYGQLGIGVTTGPEMCHFGGGGRVPVGPYDYPCSTNPVPVATALRWSSIIGGAGRTCGLTVGGEAYCWGLNSDGQLGDGSNTNSTIPVAVAGDLSFRGLAAGYAHTCGITTSDVVYCWGANGSGQLGDGTFSSSSLPVKVLGPP